MKKTFLNFTIEAMDFLSSISINQASINSFILLFCMPLIDINIYVKIMLLDGKMTNSAQTNRHSIALIIAAAGLLMTWMP